MNISILCSSRAHPVFAELQRWADRNSRAHQVEILSKASELKGGDLLFLISCSEIVGAATRGLFKETLVVHASDLPTGRGWSPYIWEILAGATELTVTLLDAEDSVDSGAIWAQEKIQISNHALLDEIQSQLFAAELRLMDFAVTHFENPPKRPQPDRKPTYYTKRTPEMSRLDVNQSIAEQFNQMRVADPDRYPTFFEIDGVRFELRLSKSKSPE